MQSRPHAHGRGLILKIGLHAVAVGTLFYIGGCFPPHPFAEQKTHSRLALFLLTNTTAFLYNPFVASADEGQ